MKHRWGTIEVNNIFKLWNGYTFKFIIFTIIIVIINFSALFIPDTVISEKTLGMIVGGIDGYYCLWLVINYDFLIR